MTILHYSLGVYPYREGGLVRYSTDLAIEQQKNQNVIYVIPGKLGLVDKSVRIVPDKEYRNLHVFRIENALPMPIYFGIKDIDAYTRPVQQSIFERFLTEYSVDIIHVHSLMGLHAEFLMAANKLHIPVFFTSHDFFGLCPITKLYKDGDICGNTCIDGKCGICSQNAHSYLKLAIGQSHLYRYLKSTRIVSALRKKVLSEKNEGVIEQADNADTAINESGYAKLNEYYRDMFSRIDVFLFNSSQTKEQYEKRLGNVNGIVIPLVLPSITDNRKKRTFMPDGVLRIGFMGEPTEFKGFIILRNAVEQTARQGYPVQLHVYNDNITESESVFRKGKYTSSDLARIYDSLDLIAVPSIWPETLSFVALEALSYAMPCMVSDHVGAKDYFADGKNGIIVPAGNKNEIIRIITTVLKRQDILSLINNEICSSDITFDFPSHVKKVNQVYQNSL